MDGTTVEPRSAGTGPLQRDVLAPVSAAKEKLAQLSGTTRSFGVIRMWPDQAVAEHENVERLREAAHLIGAEVVELDRYGRILASPGERVAGDQVDFVLHLHFETPKVYDAVSIAAMWNPMQFYFDWGFNRFWSNQLSHDIFATTGSRQIESMLERERGVLEMPALNHTIAAPIYSTESKNSYQAFYCGINWEKVDGRPGRHNALLRALDAKGKLALFGPEIVQGVKVWEGYSSYRGSLPFDGKTVIRKIWDAGACLVLSSDAHRVSGIMSNRLFEAMAAGAVVIGDDHDFIPKAIGDNYVRIPSHLSEAKRAELVVEALAELERDPDRAANMAQTAQDRLIESFFLPTQLAGLFEAAHRFRKERSAAQGAVAGALVDIIMQPVGQDADEVLQFIHALAGKFDYKANILLVVPEHQSGWFETRLGSVARIVGLAGETRTIRNPSDCLESVRPHLKSPKVAFFLGGEEVFAEEFMECCRRFAGQPVGRIGHAIKQYDDKDEVTFDYQAPHEPIEQFHPASIGSIIFDRGWLAQAPHVPGLSWQGLVRLAEKGGDAIATSPTTALIVNARRYEQMLQSGISWVKGQPDEAVLIDRLGSASSVSASGLVLRRPMPQPVKPEKVERSASLLEMFDQLSPGDKLRIGLELYKSMPLPQWLRSTVRLGRRTLRIR